MRPWATRLLHVLASAPAFVPLAIASAPVTHAQASGAPIPYIVALDPGHGGAPDDAHPEQPYDSGAIGVGGILEKDLTLDIAQRVRGLLGADLVNVVMTRDDDRFVSIDDRSAIARQSGAQLFVSIHLNSWTDRTIGGSLVLYPAADSAAFAGTMADALRTRLTPLGVDGKGTELRDDWWTHTSMPTVTVEGAYVTNPQEAALLTTAAFRQALAGAIRDGIETYAPDIARRRGAILAWNAAHPDRPVGGGSSRRGTAGSGIGRVAGGASWVLVIGVAAGSIRFRHQLGDLVDEVLATRGTTRTRRHRRRWVRARGARSAAVPPLVRPHSVYDDLWF